MPVKVKCPGCQKVLNAPDKARGKAIKCPNCQTAIKVPAGAQKKETADDSGGFDDDFLSDLDLSRAEDRSKKVCPRCGVKVGDEDLECQKCGTDLTTGEVGSTKKKRRKGPNPKQFYKTVWGDAWKFTKKNKGFVIRTAFINLVLLSVALFCTFMTLWSSNIPPKVFWGFVGFVFWMAPIGWPWYVATETIKVSLAVKNELKRVNFDFFVCVALGMKFFVWTIVLGIPFLAVFGGIGFVLFRSGNPIPGAITAGIGLLLIYSTIPVAMTHMVMPIPTPGWMFNKVLPGWSKTLGACFYWMFIVLLVALPVIVPLAGAGAAYGNRLNSFVQVMQQNARLDKSKQIVAEAEANEDKDSVSDDDAYKATLELTPLDWNVITVPAILVGVAALFSGFPMVFGSRVAGQIAYYFKDRFDLHMLEHESTYVKKEVKYDKFGKPIDPNVTPAWLKVVIGIVVLIVLFIVANIISFMAADRYLIPEGMVEMLGLPEV